MSLHDERYAPCSEKETKIILEDITSEIHDVFSSNITLLHGSGVGKLADAILEATAIVHLQCRDKKEFAECVQKITDLKSKVPRNTWYYHEIIQFATDFTNLIKKVIFPNKKISDTDTMLLQNIYDDLVVLKYLMSD